MQEILQKNHNYAHIFLTFLGLVHLIGVRPLQFLSRRSLEQSAKAVWTIDS